MGRELKIITSQPNDLIFCWQVRVQLANLRKYDLSKNYVCLIRWHDKRYFGATFLEQWDELEKDYPEATFFRLPDQDHLVDLIDRYKYIPLLRPWLLANYFKLHPELTEKAILYIDSDVIFTRKPEFGPFLDDDICYLTDTRSYIAASYFDSKIKDVDPEKLENYKKIDVFGDCMEEFGLTRAIGEANEMGSGGAQYLLKNIDHKYWEDVFTGCIKLRILLNRVNQRFFPGKDPQERENKGFQVWCADMWSVLWNLWKRDYKTECPKEMDTCWATDIIARWGEENLPLIYHDAAAKEGEMEPGHKLFWKGAPRYKNNLITPFQEDLSWVSDKYCSKVYVKQIEEANPYKKKYKKSVINP